MDKKNTPINVFLDLSKAFDTINHIILLEKLKYYGIDGIALKLMESYMTNRTQYVEIDGVKLDLLNLSTGVTQGSIIGPLLFIIYINDIATTFQIIYRDTLIALTDISL